MADHKKVKLFISSLTIANTHYLLARSHKLDEARKILIKFKVLVEVLPMNDKILELALVSDFKDFEDAIQYYTALENELDLILTRNKKDFKKSIYKIKFESTQDTIERKMTINEVVILKKILKNEIIITTI